MLTFATSPIEHPLETFSPPHICYEAFCLERKRKQLEVCLILLAYKSTTAEPQWNLDCLNSDSFNKHCFLPLQTEYDCGIEL